MGGSAERASRAAKAIGCLAILGAIAQSAGAALLPCPVSNLVSVCQVTAGDSVLEVRATSSDGGAVGIGLSIGGVTDLPFEAFKVYSFDADDFIDVVVESATQDAAARQIRVQVRESESNAIRAVGVFALDDAGATTVLEETFTFTNLLPQTVNGRFYVISDFDLGGDAADDAIAVTLAGTRIDQSDGPDAALLEVTSNAPPTHGTSRRAARSARSRRATSSSRCRTARASPAPPTSRRRGAGTARSAPAGASPPACARA